MGIPFETGSQGLDFAGQQNSGPSALESIKGLFKEELDSMPEEQFNEMLRDTHR